jgi:hypothetical protein
MCVVTITTGKTFSRDDKMAAFVLWKGKLPPKDIRNQPQLAKATLKRILMLPRTSKGSLPKNQFQNLTILMKPMPMSLQQFISRGGLKTQQKPVIL